MSRILHNDSWYSPVKSNSFYEKTYEDKIIDNSNLLFPNYYCFYFKKVVNSMWGPGIPDLVLIDKQYREWIIVEVELEHHNLQGDVEQQVKIFSTGKFGRSHAEYLFKKHPELDFEKLLPLVIGTQPSISVIVPIAKPSWWKNLLPYNAHIAVIEIWENNIGKQLLRVNGDQPSSMVEEFLTRVFRDSDVTSKGLKVENSAVLPDLPNIQIYIDGKVTLWRQVRTASGCWLIPHGKPPIDDIDSRAFNLFLDSSGNYMLKESN
jgi:hypothetical protein